MKYDININFYNTIPLDIIKLSNIFKKIGFDLYIVGGAIRDYLLSFDIKDYDLATNATPTDVFNILNNINEIKLEDTGLNQGVSFVYMNNNMYEIATFREDLTSGRKPIIKLTKDIQIDSLRRDFTVNALYYNISTKKIIDFHNGLDDIKNKIVRCIGDSNVRFLEDNLRVLRAIRLSSSKNMILSNDIEEYMSNLSKELNISQFRKNEELFKGLKINSVKYVTLLDTYNIFSTIFNMDLNIDISELNKLEYISNPLIYIFHIFTISDCSIMNSLSTFQHFLKNILLFSNEKVKFTSFLYCLVFEDYNNLLKYFDHNLIDLDVQRYLNLYLDLETIIYFKSLNIKDLKRKYSNKYRNTYSGKDLGIKIKESIISHFQ